MWRFSRCVLRQQLILDCEMDPGAADIRIPKMTIQPLIENAIAHGNLLKKSDGAIQLKIGLTDGMLHVLIKDNGIAVTDDRVCQIYDTIRQIRSKLQEVMRKYSRRQHYLILQKEGMIITILKQVKHFWQIKALQQIRTCLFNQLNHFC